MPRALPLPATSTQADFTTITLNADGTTRSAPSVSAPASSQDVGRATLATSQITIGTTATLIAAARAGRGSIKVTNTGTTVAFLGNSTGVTITTGDYLAGAVGAANTYGYQGALYGIVATGTAVVTVSEVYG